MIVIGLGPRAAGALLCALLTGGCALLTKQEPLAPRYFSAEPSEQTSPQPNPPADGAGSPRDLKLGRVTSASYLGERLVFRDSEYELGFYDDRRWTEKPEDYFRRALSRALFEQGAFRRVVSGGGPTLECELVELAELRAPAHVARARVHFILFDARSVRTEATVTVDLPIAAGKSAAEAPASVAALARALSSVVVQIVDRVSTNLEVTPASPGTAGSRP